MHLHAPRDADDGHLRAYRGVDVGRRPVAAHEEQEIDTELEHPRRSSSRVLGRRGSGDRKHDLGRGTGLPRLVLAHRAGAGHELRFGHGGAQRRHRSHRTPRRDRSGTTSPRLVRDAVGALERHGATHPRGGIDDETGSHHRRPFPEVAAGCGATDDPCSRSSRAVASGTVASSTTSNRICATDERCGASATVSGDV